VLSIHALIAAYNECEDWAEEMIRVVDENARLACDFIASHFPGVRVMRPQGTYMLFLDCGGWLREHGLTLPELLRRGASVGVFWQNGEDFFYPDSIRLNLALPRQQLEEALDRLARFAFID
jgi:cystathionine beta-lyase